MAHDSIYWSKVDGKKSTDFGDHVSKPLCEYNFLYTLLIDI